MLTRKGGWEKAKAAKAKRKREEEILEKTPSSLNYWNRPADEILILVVLEKITLWLKILATAALEIH